MAGKAGTGPDFAREAEARASWGTHDSSAAVDWGKARRVRLAKLKASTGSISLRVPVGVVERREVEAERRGVP